MKRTTFTIMTITIMLALFSSLSYTQDGTSKAPSSEETIHSITLPAIRIELKEGPGRAKTETYCNICHSVDYIMMQPKADHAQWTASVNKMIKTFGAPVLPEDAETVITYITQNYGTGK
jgi:cytochrome c5